MNKGKQNRSSSQKENKPLSGTERRKQRILETARTLINKNGVGHFRVRELADKAGVATATLYNLFGGKDGIISLALKEDYLARFAIQEIEPTQLTHAELLQKMMTESAKDALNARENTEAVVFYYFNGEAASELRDATHYAVKNFFLSILQDIDKRGDLLEWVQPDVVADDIVSATYTVLLKWVQGHLPRKKLGSRLLMAAALPFIATTKGETRASFEELMLN